MIRKGFGVREANFKSICWVYSLCLRYVKPMSCLFKIVFLIEISRAVDWDGLNGRSLARYPSNLFLLHAAAAVRRISRVFYARARRISPAFDTVANQLFFIRWRGNKLFMFLRTQFLAEQSQSCAGWLVNSCAKFWNMI